MGKNKLNANRRNFLKLSFLGGLVAVISSGALVINFKSAVGKVLNAIHPDFSVPDNVLDAFLEDATRMKLWEKLRIGQKERMIIMVYSIIPTADFLPYSDYYDKLSNRIVRAFIPATTFFQNRMDTTQSLQYIGLYNPFTRACGNPFSSMYYPPATT